MQLLIKVILPILLVLIAAIGWVIYATGHEVVSTVKTVNPQAGKGRALIVWHPGQSNFPERVMNAFAAGLMANGWRVEMTTASVQSPADISGYGLLVLGSPVYWSAPARPISNYLKRLGDLHGKQTVILLMASGNSDDAMNKIKTRTAEAHGQIAVALSLYRWRPNRENATGDNEMIAVEIAQQAAKEIKPIAD